MFYIHFYRNNSNFYIQGIIKTEQVKEQLETTERKVTHKRKEAIPLPEGSTENNRFRAVFVTTYICWVAEYADPWRVEPEEATSVMQKIWAEVYGKKVPFKITTETKAYQQVRQSFALNG